MILFVISSLLCRIQKTSLKQPSYTWALTSLLKRCSNIDAVTNNITNVANDCKNYGIKNISLSGLTINKRLHAHFINAVNNALKLDSIKYGHNFIENSNILPDNLWQNGLHLNNSGKGKLLNNFLVS